jgi:hypothetical protein
MMLRDFRPHPIPWKYPDDVYPKGPNGIINEHIMSIVTALKYLGINLDDMQAAMDLHGDYQKKIRMGIFQKGGVQRA